MAGSRHSLMKVCLIAGLALAGISACSDGDEFEQPPAADTGAIDETLIADGRDIAEAQCASCHAIGLEGDSPRADAPPLRTALADYDPEALAVDFREHIHVGHPDMPDFDFGPTGTDAILAYLVSINTAQQEE
ncbi:MAG: cytochrome c [Henriciella sp.]